MAYYDALIAKWPTIPGTSESKKLIILNEETVPGPDRMVPMVEIILYLRNNALWQPIVRMAKDADLLEPTKYLPGMLGSVSAVNLNADTRITDIDTTLPVVTNALIDLVSGELITQDQANEIVDLKNTYIPWWQAPVAEGGGGLNGPVSHNDLVAAGLVT